MADRTKQVPHLGSIPEEWDAVPLEAVAHPDRRIVYGIVQAGPHVPDGVPYIRSTDVGGHIDVKSLLRTSPEIASRYKRSEVRPGDIVFSLRGNIGAMSIVPDKLLIANLTQGTARISVNGSHVAHYVRYALQSAAVRNRIAAVAKGSTFREITLHDLRRITIPLPERREQAAIARILCCCDNLLSGLSRRHRRARAIKRGLMQQLLTGKRRFKEFARQQWRKCRIGDVMHAAVRPLAWDDKALYRLVIVRRWAEGVALRGELRGHQIKVKKLQTIHTGDVLISHIQSAYGAMALVPPEFDGCQVSELYTILVPNEPAMFDGRYFAYLTQRKDMWHRAYLASNGFFAERLRLNFSPEEFLHQPITVPVAGAEQRKIVSVLAAGDNEIRLLQHEGSLLEDQKMALMQKLLTGKVRLKQKEAG